MSSKLLCWGVEDYATLIVPYSITNATSFCSGHIKKMENICPKSSIPRFERVDMNIQCMIMLPTEGGA